MSGYNIYQPRITIESPGDRRTEVGQGASMGEAMFFLSIGYTVHLARWNGRIFEPAENYLPEDLH